MVYPVDVIIPARDECETIAGVVREIPRAWVRSVTVVDNGSRDGTAEVARRAGAQVVHEPLAGYGRACLRALEALPRDGVVVFLVADGSDDPRELPRVVDPVLEGRADLVIGSRFQGWVAPGAMPPWQSMGSRVAALGLRLRFGQSVSDLGPFRAISRPALDGLAMRDPTYGWTLEMQIKAARQGLRVREVPVAWRQRRGGSPKVAGTLKGTLGASAMISRWLYGAFRGPEHDPR